MKKPEQIKEGNYVFMAKDMGPPEHEQVITSVWNYIYNPKKLSLGDHVLIRYYDHDYNGRIGIIEKIIKIIYKKQANILTIKFDKLASIKVRLSQVKKLPS